MTCLKCDFDGLVVSVPCTFEVHGDVRDGLEDTPCNGDHCTLQSGTQGCVYKSATNCASNRIIALKDPGSDCATDFFEDANLKCQEGVLTVYPKQDMSCAVIGVKAIECAPESMSIMGEIS